MDFIITNTIRITRTPFLLLEHHSYNLSQYKFLVHIFYIFLSVNPEFSKYPNLEFEDDMSETYISTDGLYSFQHHSYYLTEYEFLVQTCIILSTNPDFSKYHTSTRKLTDEMIEVLYRAGVGKFYILSSRQIIRQPMSLTRKTVWIGSQKLESINSKC